MNIIVCAKQVVDVSEIKIDKASNTPITTGIPKKISDFDKNALEEAIKIKEQHGGTITVLTVAGADAKEQIKELLAMGADKAVLITPQDTVDPLNIARLLQAGVKHIGDYDLILCGEASIDQFSGLTGPALAGRLGISQLTYTTNITASKDSITCTRNMGANTITETSTYPALITVTKEINTPRLPNLMQIMQSANKPIEELTPDDLAVEIQEGSKEVNLTGVTMQRKNTIFNDDLENAITTIVEELDTAGVFN